VLQAAKDCASDCAGVLADLRLIEDEMAGGSQYTSFGDNLSLTRQVSIAKDKVQGQVYQQWCSGNKAGCGLAIASPLFPALAAVAPAMAGEAITACMANLAGCNATINSLADGLLADGAVGAAGLASGKTALERLAAAKATSAANEARISNKFYRDGAAVDYGRAFEFQPGRTLAAEEANARTVSYGNNALNPQMPYARETLVTERLAQPGEKLYMIEYERQPQPGAWASQKQYSSLEQARQELALLPEFKDPNKGNIVVREYTVIAPTPVREGTVGSLTSAIDGKTYAGGGKQTEFMFDRPQPESWKTYLRLTDESTLR